MSHGQVNGDDAGLDAANDIPAPPSSKKAGSDQVSAWMLTGWLVLAPLLMLITIWVLTIFRKH
jgi:hypothetical protein